MVSLASIANRGSAEFIDSGSGAELSTSSVGCSEEIGDELLGIRKNTLKNNGSIGMSKTGLFWNKEMVWDWNERYGTETGWYGSEANII